MERTFYTFCCTCDKWQINNCNLIFMYKPYDELATHKGCTLPLPKDKVHLSLTCEKKKRKIFFNEISLMGIWQSDWLSLPNTQIHLCWQEMKGSQLNTWQPNWKTYLVFFFVSIFSFEQKFHYLLYLKLSSHQDSNSRRQTAAKLRKLDALGASLLTPSLSINLKKKERNLNIKGEGWRIKSFMLLLHWLCFYCWTTGKKKKTEYDILNIVNKAGYIPLPSASNVLCY